MNQTTLNADKKKNRLTAVRFSFLFAFFFFLAAGGTGFSATKTWTGAVSTAWDNPSNWTGGLPGTSDLAFISRVDNACTVSNSVVTGLVTIENNAFLNFGNGTNGLLRIYGSGDFGNNGTVNLNEGTIIFYNSINFANNFVFNAGSGTIIMNGGTWNNGNNADFNPGTSTVEFTGTNQVVVAPNSGIEFYNAEFTGGGEMTLIGEVTVLNDAFVSTNTTLIVDTITVIGEYVNNGPIVDDQPHVQQVYTPTLTSVEIEFYAPVSLASAQTTANYVITNGVTVLSATRNSTNLHRVQLTTTSLIRGAEYMLIVNNIQDTNNPAGMIAPNSLKRFVASAAPELFSISPNIAIAGSPAFTMTLTGTNFVTNSVVLFNGIPGVTTYVANNQLTAVVSGIALLSIGSVEVLVTNAYPNKGISSALSVTVTTNAVPGFVKGSDVTVWEDSGAYTMANWASSISAGSTNESSQALTFVVTNNDNTLFSVQPSISSNGTLSFTPAANANGSATVTVRLQDDGGIISGGIDTSDPQTFTIEIVPVNDVPSFSKGANQTVNPSSRQVTVSGWAGQISSGPADESSQNLSFIVSNDSPADFVQQPAISANGTLTFEVDSQVSNVLVTVTVRLMDDGGTGYGGTDTSPLQTFRISLSTSFGGYTIGDDPNSGPSGMWLGNLRGLDTWRDLIIANYSTDTISVRLCRDNGTFSPAANYAVGRNPIAVLAGDFSRDGKEDIVCANSGTNTISVLLNQGGGKTMRAASHFVVGSTPNPQPMAIAVSDVNRDGRLDVITANFNENNVSVLKNSANGVLGNLANYTVGGGPMSVQIIDLNGDGVRDLLTANKTDGTLTILHGRMDGTFEAGSIITLFPGGDPQPVHALAGDFDGDGLTDIVTANYNSNSVSILFGNTAGLYSVSASYPVGSNPRRLLGRDLNRDNLADIAVVNFGSASVHTLINGGGRNFETGDIVAVGSNPMSIVGSNFDSDGATDFAVSNFGDGTISIFRYSGPLAYGQRVNVYEDTPTAITLKGSALEDSGSLQYVILELPAHGTLSGSGANLTYTPAQDYCGADSFRFKVVLQRANTITESSPALVSLNVLPRNDGPSFQLSTNLIVLMEDSPLTYVTNFAVNISTGPTNERAQSFSFLMDAGSLLPKIRPAISSSGKLSLVLAKNFTGDVLVSTWVRDNGGRATNETNMSSPRTFTVSVIRNPVKPLKGTYSGLARGATSVSHERSGYFQFKMTAERYCGGKIWVSGKAYGFSGRFNNEGFAQITILRPLLPALTVSLQLDIVSGSDLVTGSVSDGTWTVPLSGDRLIYGTGTNQPPQFGKYTFRFTATNQSATVPVGSSFGNISILTNGLVQISGVLADGALFTQTTYVSKNGKVPFYAPVYAGKGSVLSWMLFTNRTTSSVESVVYCTKTAAAAGSLYKTGYTNQSLLCGSSFSVPSSGVRVVNITNGIIVLKSGNLTNTVTNSLCLATNNSFAVTGSPLISLSVTTKDGRLKGSFIHPVTKRSSSIHGIVLQQDRCGSGFFLGTNASGVVLIRKN